MRRWIIGVAALVLLMGAQAAWAHVEVAPTEAARGSVTTFTFSVPNEDDSASTVGVEIAFPENSAFTTITPEDKVGWTATPSATSVKWTGGSFNGDKEEEFSLTLGPLPNGERLTFKALQTYSNGNVVRWIDEPGARAVELEHPAPFVTLTGDAVVADTTTSSAVPRATTTTEPATTKDKKNVAPLIFGALVLAGIGAGIAIGARGRSPKP